MNPVFLLQHSYEIEEFEETKTIGIFSTRKIAEEVIEEYKKVDGFKNYQNCFFIDEYKIDSKHWVEGFFNTNE